jgi:hypothetical protein
LRLIVAAAQNGVADGSATTRPSRAPGGNRSQATNAPRSSNRNDPQPNSRKDKNAK